MPLQFTDPGTLYVPTVGSRRRRHLTNQISHFSLSLLTPLFFFFFCIPLPIVPNCNVMILSLALSSSCAPGCWSEPLLNIHKEGKGGETDEESKESHTLSEKKKKLHQGCNSLAVR